MEEQKQIEAMARLDGEHICKGCGCEIFRGHIGIIYQTVGCATRIHNLPGYLTDRNAVQRVIDGMSDEEIGDYHVALWATTSPTGTLKDFHTAKCPQKVEAILKAKGLWK